ncbi:pyridoxamine 5'-phosphate oxidase [Actinocorallia longicatena]|uniref:Pyridoxine/pyridoxamine 5'-phosphate oxidase n=1 Tax=Actinocorallia longicatena TaxID=111803 RepID=A0ABP6Q2N4_9ACTN
MDRSPADPAALRESYEDGELVESVAPPEPFSLFTGWFADAVGAGLPDPNAMVLSTATAAGEPHARTVLLKGFGADGFRFFTNHTSRKGLDLAENPRASLLFPWHARQRQVIVNGTVERLPQAETAEYFHSRPHGSQLGAWASHQSTVVSSREELEKRFTEIEARWPEKDSVPVPDFWGGYLVVPTTVEFWQGRKNRLHDRLRYRRDDGAWILERLSP